MDITTLAAAKAYTDKKVAEGGSAPSKKIIVEITSIDYSTVDNIMCEATQLSDEESAAVEKAFEEAYENMLPVRIIFNSGDGYRDEVVAHPTVYYSPDGSVEGKLFYSIFYMGVVQVSINLASENPKWCLTNPGTSGWLN